MKDLNDRFFLGLEDPKHEIIHQNIKDGIKKIEHFIDDIQSSILFLLNYKIKLHQGFKKERDIF